MQNPYIRQFGKKNFQVQSYLDEVLSKNDTQMIKQEYKGLKKSHQSLQREIGNFLFHQYHTFLETSDKLETVKYQIDDAKAILAQFQLVINSLRGQMDRLDQTSTQWDKIMESHQKNEDKMNSFKQKQQDDIFDGASKHETEMQYLQEQLEVIEQQIHLNKFEESISTLNDLNNHLDQLGDFDYEQLVLIRASSDQLRNNLDSLLQKQISLHMKSNDLSTSLSLQNIFGAVQSYLNYQQKLIQGKLKKIEPIVFQVMTMQQCQTQSQRLQQSVSVFVDFINNLVKDFQNKFIDGKDISRIMCQDDINTAKSYFAQWLKQQTETSLCLHISLYLQNELVQHQLGENLKQIVRLVKALQGTNVNICHVLERSIAPMVLNSIDRLLNERINNQTQEKGLKKHNSVKTSLETLFIVDYYQLKNIAELEEEKKQDNFESIISMQSMRKHFFRKMLKFLDKNIIQNMDLKLYQYISVQISNFMIIRFIQKLDSIVQREEILLQAQTQKTDQMSRYLINEFSSVQVIRLLQIYFLKQDFQIVKPIKEKLEKSLTEMRQFYTNRFKKLFYKDLLIKLLQCILKDNDYEKQFFSDETVDYTTINPAQCFIQVSKYLNEIKIKIEKDLKLDDESEVFHAKIVFKEHLVMFMLATTLELFKDLLLMQLQELETKYSDYKEYINKLVVEKKLQARFVLNSGTQQLMFGIWYLILTMTSKIKTKEVKGSSESQRVTQSLQQLTQDIQNSRKSIQSRESYKSTEINVEVFKNRILELDDNMKN
ncbi:UNKNOWN [Stylonychia lemnae]|uniref:Uncharacterized protein n=1 Tax=Stylonychia lemnae TaxID=5949 RepID=A0A078AM22_STYLE|nr:UNKNOWN [Stylonychia lemnae]|eukprot:CDW82467.1 UNKNOWN [Stylonychia lemnae]